MKKLVFATNNAHKLDEIRAILAGRVEVVSLNDIGCNEDIAETAETLEGNALIKAHYIYDKYGLYCFADDTGLEVEALGGAPGVYSARYAGEHCSPEDNISKLLGELAGVAAPRRAAFRTVIALIDETGEHLFEGCVRGEIIEQREGTEGFGYDPIFRPEGYAETFASLGEAIKNQISHRARAVVQLAEYLCGD
ncbi:MAG: non-canonical purine NTP diphosphatase [Porphyromonadaceae bacterium]|nr:non-canonical purine NTP diphosphatase [Porphyromonadaceae bacterium]